MRVRYIIIAWSQKIRTVRARERYSVLILVSNKYMKAKYKMAIFIGLFSLGVISAFVFFKTPSAPLPEEQALHIPVRLPLTGMPSATNTSIYTGFVD